MLPLSIDTHAFKHIVMVFAIARPVCEGVAAAPGDGIGLSWDEGVVDLRVGAAWVFPVNIEASGIGLCARFPAQDNAAINI